MDSLHLKKALAALAVIPALAFAGANDMLYQQRNSADSGNNNRLVAFPAGGGLFWYDTPNLMPIAITLGTGLVQSGGVLGLSNPPVNADWASSSGLSQILNKPTIPAAQVNSDWSASSGISQILNKPTLATVATTGQYSDLIGAPSVPSRSFSYSTRSLNTCFQVSSTRDALVSYSVDIQTSLTLLAGQQGTVYLRIYTNSGCSTGQQEVTRFVNGQTGALTVGLSLVQNVTATLTGVIPAGSYVQLVTENNTGTPTFTARPGQETLL